MPAQADIATDVAIIKFIIQIQDVRCLKMEYKFDKLFVEELLTVKVTLLTVGVDFISVCLLNQDRVFFFFSFFLTLQSVSTKNLWQPV